MEYPESVFANERVTYMVPTEQHELGCGSKAVTADATEWRHRHRQIRLSPGLRQWALALCGAVLASAGWAEIGLGDDRLVIIQPTSPVEPNQTALSQSVRPVFSPKEPRSTIAKGPWSNLTDGQRSVSSGIAERQATAPPSLTMTHDRHVVGLQSATMQPDVHQSIYLSQTDGSSPLEPAAETPAAASPSDFLDLEPGVLENSPVLQDWLQEVPDIADEIRNSPSFRTRLRLGYAQFPSSGQIGGFNVGIEDVFVIPDVGLTVSGDYARSWNGQRESYGAEVRYYVLPLGGYVNLTPTVGYRSLTTPQYQTDGVNVGFRVMFVPSRGGGQMWR
jgi:hypothetical protein